MVTCTRHERSRVAGGMHCQHAESGRCSGAGPTGREGQALVGLGERGVGFARRMWNGGAQSDKGWIRHDERKHAHVHTHEQVCMQRLVMMTMVLSMMVNGRWVDFDEGCGMSS